VHARRSLAGFAIGAGLFLCLGIYMNREIGAGWLDNPGPLAVVAIIGGTIAGLLAPLFRAR